MWGRLATCGGLVTRLLTFAYGRLAPVNNRRAGCHPAPQSLKWNYTRRMKVRIKGERGGDKPITGPSGTTGAFGRAAVASTSVHPASVRLGASADRLDGAIARNSWCGQGCLLPS